MTIVVDFNILSSALLQPGDIAHLLISNSEKIEFLAPEFVEEEMAVFWPKLLEFSALSNDEFC
jgi:predicted nucleic acid-binding protein